MSRSVRLNGSIDLGKFANTCQGHPAENRFPGISGFPENFLDNIYGILAIKIPL
jgi:hypothetical protein